MKELVASKACALGSKKRNINVSFLTEGLRSLTDL